MLIAIRFNEGVAPAAQEAIKARVVKAASTEVGAEARPDGVFLESVNISAELVAEIDAIFGEALEVRSYGLAEFFGHIIATN